MDVKVIDADQNARDMRSLRTTADIKMKISPNPAMDNFSIVLDDFDPKQEFEYEILSLDGNRHLKGQINNAKTPINISNLSNGIYVVKVFTTNNFAIARLVKY